MALTEEQINIISEHPLNDTLDRSRVKLRDYEVTDHQTLRDEIASLVGVLISSTAAYHLSSPDASDNVATKLFSITQHFRGGGLRLEQFRPLVCSVVDGAPDIDIWEAVFSIIETLSPPSQPGIATTYYNGTPVKSNSSRLADSETREIVEEELFQEIKSCVYRDVGGFWDKLFDSENWREENKKMLKHVMTAHNGKTWKDFPSNPEEKLVWTWLLGLEERLLADPPNKLYTTRTANQFKERKGQMDIFFQKPARKANSTFTYKDVLVVGEQKKSDDKGKFKATLLQLTRHVRSVFADQPTRRLVHAFSLCGSKMELWVFDRSGLYSSGQFDIHDEPDKFARAFVGYATMDDDAMGLDTFIERKRGHRYVTCKDTSGKELRIELKELLVRQKAIVCRGTTCFRTRNGHVAKFAWASDKQKPEVKHLELALKSSVKGVARVEAYQYITTVADMRKGLTFPKPHKFQDSDDTPFGPWDPAAGAQSSLANAGINTLNGKRKSSSENTTRSKRLRSSNRKSGLNREFEEQPSSDKARPSLYTTNPEDPYENRIYSCLVTSPAGRVISDFRSIKELLEALRDSIRAHQSLYNAGNILHRDISSNNIIITDPEIADGFKGMLIDLDLAKVRDSGPSGARRQTGTMQFMAIEVLRKADRTYRHDLESFFYVLWMCARYSWVNGLGGQENPPRQSVLREWEIGSFMAISRVKAYHMSIGGLEEVMDEFPGVFDVVKPLCLKIRSIMFGETARLGIVTLAGDPNQLYKDIIVAYEEAIDGMLAWQRQ